MRDHRTDEQRGFGCIQLLQPFAHRGATSLVAFLAHTLHDPLDEGLDFPLQHEARGEDLDRLHERLTLAFVFDSVGERSQVACFDRGLEKHALVTGW